MEIENEPILRYRNNATELQRHSLAIGKKTKVSLRSSSRRVKAKTPSSNGRSPISRKRIRGIHSSTTVRELPIRKDDIHQPPESFASGKFETTKNRFPSHLKVDTCFKLPFITLLPNNRRITDDYEISNPPQILGCGGTSIVFAAKHRVLGHNVAVKALTKADIFRKNYINFEEYHVLTLLRYRHPSIINMIDAFETDDNLYFIMDYCHGGELFDLIRHRCTSKTCISSESNDSRTTQTMTEQEIIHIIKQLLSAVHFLHSHGIVHRDIKPENILLSNRAPEDLSVKLVDFGLAKTFKDIKNEDVALDIYGVGLCLLFMMTGSLATNHLFTQSHPGHEHISKAWMDTLSQNLTHYYSDAMMDLLTQLLQHRLSAAEALEHVCMRARI